MNQRFIYGVIALAIAAVGFYWKANTRVTQFEPVTAASVQSADVDISSVVEMTMGSADAKVTIIEYASFTCPHCANFHKGVFKQLKADYIDTDQVHFIYRDVYFDRYGLMASQIARCGGEERFFGIVDMIYTQQKEWIGSGDDPAQIATNLLKIGKGAGLGEDQLNACLDDKARAETLVAWYNQNREDDNIRSTPSFIINGEPYTNMDYSEFKEVIDAKLAE